jgi:osmotically-inducible protein OsmY
MFRALVRMILLIVVLVGGAAFLLGWWSSDRVGPAPGTRDAVGTSGTGGGVNPDRAREVGAAVGETTANAANEARRSLADGRITAKIKAKMALDDSVKALSVDVDTDGPTVTVSGVVDSAAQRDRVLELARETDGVTSVVDRLRIR